MKVVSARVIWICFAVLLVALAAGALYAVRSLEGTRDSLEKTAEVGEQAGVAVSEMKGGVAGIERGTTGYVRTDDPKHREYVGQARDAFKGPGAGTKTSWVPPLEGTG